MLPRQLSTLAAAVRLSGHTRRYSTSRVVSNPWTRRTKVMAYIEVVLLTIVATLITAVVIAFYEPKGDRQ